MPPLPLPQPHPTGVQQRLRSRSDDELCVRPRDRWHPVLLPGGRGRWRKRQRRLARLRDADLRAKVRTSSSVQLHSVRVRARQSAAFLYSRGDVRQSSRVISVPIATPRVTPPLPYCRSHILFDWNDIFKLLPVLWVPRFVVVASYLGEALLSVSLTISVLRGQPVMGTPLGSMFQCTT